MDWRQWPGKSALVEGGPDHPAAFHMLDVAAVAERLIAPFRFPSALQSAFLLLIGLHDLGKISDSFRNMLRDGVAQGVPHWELSEALFFDNDARLAARLGGVPEVRQAVYAAVAGHHGRPPRRPLGALPLPLRLPPDLFGLLRKVGTGREAAPHLIDAFLDLWPDASLDALGEDEAGRLSWWLPGLCTTADWIGSNTRWFPPTGVDPGLVDYLADARLIAGRAVQEAGLAGAMARPGALFEFALRPLQAACAEVALTDGPMLAILEDETGSGKTEAALILAHRMALAGKGRGVYFALPTMATADAMFQRATQSVGRMFSNPTVTLAHGRSGLSDSFRDLVWAGSRTGREDGLSSSDWLAESNRRALLADIGIGTIDQALLAVLPVKFQTLRYFGLSSKILIVDEVHEMGEPYIGQELVALLRMHRAAGGSAILLTATLPLALRRDLLATYDGHSTDTAYPALTVAGGDRITDFARDARPGKGPVRVERLSTEADAVALICEQAARGAACVWVRNAVDDAIAAVEALQAKGLAVQLLHARFALCDRKRIEAAVLGRVGKDGRGRAGYVLVSTQVVEASLDLDFDVMVSDLAPVASLVQRAGRLWRHMEERPASSRPAAAPVLHVLSPDPDDLTDDRWLHGTLDRGAWVYALPVQWRTARVLFAAGQIEAPHGLRALIEAVHGAVAEPVPAVLEAAEQGVLGKDAASRGLAAQNIVEFSGGYRRGGRGADDVQYPTRLGDETRTLCLARRTAAGLVPWAEGAGADGWALSEVSARLRKFEPLKLPDSAMPEIAAVHAAWPEWRRAAVHLCPVGDGGVIVEGLVYSADIGLVFSSPPARE